MEIFLMMGAAVVLCVLLFMGMRASTLMERARCSAIVAGRLCDCHTPKRDLGARLGEPCDSCDRVAECLDYIENGQTYF